MNCWEFMKCGREFGGVMHMKLVFVRPTLMMVNNVQELLAHPVGEQFRELML